LLRRFGDRSRGGAVDRVKETIAKTISLDFTNVWGIGSRYT
jgi:hypothetical protein